MRRLVLPTWLVALGAVVAWLRQLPTGGDAGFAAARLLALAAATYLLAATVLNIAFAAAHLRVRLPLVPIIVAASLAGPVAGMPAFATTTSSSPPAAAPSAAPPVMHRIDTPPAAITTTTTAPTRAAPVATPAPVDTWTVRHGDCFWTIAAHLTRARVGRVPTNAEIAVLWHRLIDMNRSRLVRPNDPSLLFAGQVLVLPPA